MATKDDHLNNPSQIVNNNGRYDNLNLCESYKCPLKAPLHYQTKTSNHQPLKGHNRTLSFYDADKEKFNSWDKTSNPTSWDNLKRNETEIDKTEDHMKEKNDSKNDSSLSLYIRNYENSDDTVTDSSKILNKKKSFTWTSNNYSGNPFEIPRQQKDRQDSEPEVAQFRASQRLLNPNDHNSLNVPPRNTVTNNTQNVNNVSSDEEEDSDDGFRYSDYIGSYNKRRANVRSRGGTTGDSSSVQRTIGIDMCSSAGSPASKIPPTKIAINSDQNVFNVSLDEEAVERSKDEEEEEEEEVDSGREPDENEKVGKKGSYEKKSSTETRIRTSQTDFQFMQVVSELFYEEFDLFRGGGRGNKEVSQKRNAHWEYIYNELIRLKLPVPKNVGSLKERHRTFVRDTVSKKRAEMKSGAAKQQWHAAELIVLQHTATEYLCGIDIEPLGVSETLAATYLGKRKSSRTVKVPKKLTFTPPLQKKQKKEHIAKDKTPPRLYDNAARMSQKAPIPTSPPWSLGFRSVTSSEQRRRLPKAPTSVQTPVYERTLSRFSSVHSDVSLHQSPPLSDEVDHVYNFDDSFNIFDIDDDNNTAKDSPDVIFEAMVEKDTVKPRPSLKHIKKEIDQRFSSGSSIPHQSSTEISTSKDSPDVIFEAMVEKDTVKPRPSLKHIKKEIDQRFSSGSSIPHQSSTEISTSKDSPDVIFEAMVEKDTVKPRPSLKHIKKEIDQRFSSGSSIPHQSSPTSDDDNQREATPDATTDETPLKGTSYSLENITKGEAPKNSRNSKEIFEIALAAQRNLHAASARLFRTVHYDEQSRIRQNKLAEELLSSLKSKLVHEEAEAKAKAELATLRLQQEHSKVNKSATNTP